jgi:hypothetical protein
MEYENVVAMISTMMQATIVYIMDAHVIMFGVAPEPEAVYRRMMDIKGIISPEYHALVDAEAAEMLEMLQDAKAAADGDK